MCSLFITPVCTQRIPSLALFLLQGTLRLRLGVSEYKQKRRGPRGILI